MLLQSQHSSCGSARARPPGATRYNSSRCRSISARAPCLAAASAASAATTGCSTSSSSSVSQQQQCMLAVAVGVGGPRTASTQVVVCRDAPRPMWAAKQNPEPGPTASALVRMITNSIKDADSITALEDVYNEWGGSFDYIHTAAAMVKCAKLSRGRQGAGLSKHLARTWLTVLPDAEVRQCANVLWACSKMGVADAQLWVSTWGQFVQLVQQEADAAVPVRGLSQNIANALLACAKLRNQPTADDLQLLLQVFLSREVLAAAEPQHIANMAWAISQLHQLPSWQDGASEQQLHQLLGEEQLQLLLTDRPQALTNVLLALARMSTGSAPLISLSFAQAAAKQLLAGAVQQGLRGWGAQHFTNSMGACAALALAEEGFVSVAFAAAPRWLAVSKGLDLAQAAYAAVQLQRCDEVFMQHVLQRANQVAVLQGQSTKQGRSASPSSRDLAIMVAMCCEAVDQLDMPPLAGAARQLVANSGLGKLRNVHPVNLNKLFVFHSWLLQHQLLDGKGLAGVLTEQQLQKGAKEAAEFGEK